MGSTEQKTLQSILQAIIDQGNATVTQVNSQVASGTGNLEVVKDLKLQELVGATANHTITLEAKAQELIQLISEQGLRIRINQPAHGFLFNPVQFDTTANKYVKATVSTGADAMAIKVTDDFFDLVSSGSYVIPQGAVDSKGAEFVIDDFYFLDATGAGLIARDEPIRYYQPLFLVYSDRGIKTASINVNPMVDKLAQIVMPDGLNGFQLEEDMRLHTEAKSVVGGINEMKSRVDGLELEVGQNKSDILSKQTFENIQYINVSRGNGNVAKIGTSGVAGEYIFGGAVNDFTEFMSAYIRIGNDEKLQYTTASTPTSPDAKTRNIFHTGNCLMYKDPNYFWAKFITGMIVQFGNTQSAQTQNGTVTFPVPFSGESTYSVVAISNTASGNMTCNITQDNGSKGASFGYNQNMAKGIRWIAIGY